MTVSLPHRSVCVLAGPALVAVGALLSGTGPAGELRRRAQLECFVECDLRRSGSTEPRVWSATTLTGGAASSRESLPRFRTSQTPSGNRHEATPIWPGRSSTAKGSRMPKMKKKLGSVDVKAMVAFVRGFKDGKQVVEEEPEVGSEPEKRSEGSAALAAGFAVGHAFSRWSVKPGAARDQQELPAVLHDVSWRLRRWK